jgi:endonuclease/exonuclease/phosphatase family metal-dependent hydrolase
MPSARTIRVMTWNIHGGIGPDRKRDLARVVDVIKAHNPDVLALQEVDSRGRHPDEPLPLAYFSQALGQHQAEARLSPRTAIAYHAARRRETHDLHMAVRKAFRHRDGH